MSIRSVMIGVLALVFGGSAALGINMLRGKTPAPVETVPVVVSAGEIGRFSTITAELLKTRDYPKDLVPEGSFTKIEDVVDRSAIVRFIPGEPILNDKITPPDAGIGVPGVIPPGMRMVTIHASTPEAGVAGFILPGHKVDVLCTLTGESPGRDTGGGETYTLLENVEILAVDQVLDTPDQNKIHLAGLRSVSLLVTPKQSAVLKQAQSSGNLHLTLRNPLDTKSVPDVDSGVTLAELRFPHRDRPWDERIKGIFEAGEKLLAQLPKLPPKEEEPEEVATPAPEPEPVEPPPPPKIRTLRGNLAGAVTVGG